MRLFGSSFSTCSAGRDRGDHFKVIRAKKSGQYKQKMKLKDLMVKHLVRPIKHSPE